ncbi:MAG: hypothetical protein GY805_38055 [Chloroflexi bacterium]|nr:hypothetical protein [Chloroflexota bacterium]
MTKRTILIGTAVFTLIILLAAGAFTAVKLLSDNGEGTAVVSGGGRVMQSVSSQNGGPSISIQTTILPASELPDEQSTAFGILNSREDNTLIIGTGAIDLEVDVEVNSETGQESTTLIPTTNGPKLEVVLTPDTILYRDVTDMSLQTGQESGEREIVQAVRQVDSAEGISDDMEIEVWGERRGDRIIATVLVFGPLGGGAFE